MVSQVLCAVEGYDVLTGWVIEYVTINGEAVFFDCNTELTY